MGFSDVFNKFIGNDQGDEYERDEYIDDGPVEPQTNSGFTPAKPAFSSANQPAKLQVMIIEPKTFEEAAKIGQNLQQMRPTIINFDDTDESIENRIVDFMSGASYALQGRIEQISKHIYIVVPSNVSIDYSEKSYPDISKNFSSWKESQL